MRYIEIRTGLGISQKTSAFERLIRTVLPSANPDLEELIGKAERWWLEIGEDGEPRREIGFDEHQVPVVVGPVAGNHGFLLDASDDWSEVQGDREITASEFDDIWKSTWDSFDALDRRNS